MITKEKVEWYEKLIREGRFVIQFLRLVVRVRQIIWPNFTKIVKVLRINLLSTDKEIDGGVVKKIRGNIVSAVTTRFKPKSVDNITQDWNRYRVVIDRNRLYKFRRLRKVCMSHELRSKE